MNMQRYRSSHPFSNDAVRIMYAGYSSRIHDHSPEGDHDPWLGGQPLRLGMVSGKRALQDCRPVRCDWYTFSSRDFVMDETLELVFWRTRTRKARRVFRCLRCPLHAVSSSGTLPRYFVHALCNAQCNAMHDTAWCKSQLPWGHKSQLGLQLVPAISSQWKLLKIRQLN